MSRPIVLLTGATGFVGGASAAELLSTPTQPYLVLLVRADSVQDASARVWRSLARFLSLEEVDRSRGRWEVVVGDLTNPRTLSSLSAHAITHVVHLAANTSLRSKRHVHEVNRVGTHHLVQSCARLAALRRFLHVSTAYVTGAPAPALIHEDDFPQPDTRHLAEYTRSKAETERDLRQWRQEIPLLIARPSVVVGHSTRGCQPSASLFWYYRALSLLQMLPAPARLRKDIVPVDYVARALVWLLFHPEPQHLCYHVSAGEGACVTWGEIAQAIGGAIDACKVITFADLSAQRERLCTILGLREPELFLRMVETLLPFSQSGVEVFDNRRLLTAGFDPPPRFTEYLPLCLSLPANRSVEDQLRDDC